MTGSTKTEALVVGHITGDRYGEQLLPGGPAYYGTRTLLGLGARVQLLTSTGFLPGDLFDHPHLETIGAGEPGGRTTIFENTYDEGGNLSQLVGPPAPPVAPSRSTGARTPDLLLLCPAMGEVSAPSWIDHVESKHVGLGLQGFSRRRSKAEIKGELAEVVHDPLALESLPLENLTAVFLSEEDLRNIGKADLLQELVARCPAVFLTMGERGCAVHFNGEVTGVNAFPTSAVDPTGAGDTFAAATMYALARGRHPAQAAALGNAAASIVVEGKGGTCLDRIGEAFTRSQALRTA